MKGVIVVEFVLGNGIPVDEAFIVSIIGIWWEEEEEEELSEVE